MTSQIKTTELPIASDADFDSSDFVLILDDGITKRLPRQEMIDNFLPFMQGEKGNTGATGIKGDKGDTGGRGLTGATGAQGIQGIQGIAGATGAQGQKGWSPILAVVSDGARRVLQVTDWAGGAVDKPATGVYVGATGLVTAIGDAIDIRGEVGATGATGATGEAGADGADGVDGADGTSTKQITTITHEPNNAIKTTFSDATFVTSDAPKRLLGWASYQDQVYTNLAPFSLVDGIKSTLPNNSGVSLTSSLPTGVTSLYNALTSKITPAAVGDGLHLVIRFMAIPSAINAYLSFGVDIGGVADIFQDTIILPRGAGTPNPVNICIQGYALSTFIANGGLIKLTAIGGNVQVYNIEFQIHRTSVA